MKVDFDGTDLEAMAWMNLAEGFAALDQDQNGAEWEDALQRAKAYIEVHAEEFQGGVYQLVKSLEYALQENYPANDDQLREYSVVAANKAGKRGD